MLRKYAVATVLDAYVAGDQAQVQKTAHRAVFDYDPKPGFLYVRSRMISSRCNDNHDEFPAEEIKAAWKTAIGKPAFVNHHNETHKRMRGVIIDAALHEDTLPDGKPDIWIEALHEIDAKRFPKLAEAILAGRVNRTSMGCDVGFSVCSACGNKASTPAEYCDHIPRMKGKVLYRHTASGKREGHLIREICHKLSFFENSFLVEDPADPTAVVTGVDDRGLRATAMRKGAPFAGYEDFEECEEKNADKGDPSAYCGEIKHRAEGMISSLPSVTAEIHPETGCPSCGNTEDFNVVGAVGACNNCGEVFDTRRSLQQNMDEKAFNRSIADERSAKEKSDRDAFKSVTPNRTEAHPGSPPTLPQHAQEILRQERMRSSNPMRPGVPKGDAIHDRQELMLSRSRPYRIPEGPTEVRHLSSLPSAEAVRYEKATDHPFFKEVKLSPQHIVDAYDEADEPTKAQGMRWYSDAHHIARSLDPDGDAHRGAGVLAAYSPRSAWPVNLFNASNTLKNRRAVRIGEGMNVMGQHAKSAAKIVEEDNHYFQVFKTPKITDFAHLIAHGGDDDECERCAPHKSPEYPKQAVVVDRHALSVAAGRRMTDNDIGRAPLGTRKFYEHVAEQYRKASKQISDRDGTTVHPHQLQAITWLQQQKRNAAADEGESFGGRGRVTRDRNAWSAWEQHAHETHPGLAEENIHVRNPHRKAMRVLSSLPFLAYGETKAPQDVDTLRAESCPVCGEADAFDGDRCQVCHFIQPPAMFTDPDTGVARQMDLKKDEMGDQAQVGPDGMPLNDGSGMVDPNDPTGMNQPMTDMPGMAEDQIADLFCPACGFSADTQQPMTNNDPSMPSEQQGLMEGDVCPNCGQATMLSPNDVGELGGEVPQEIADDADADGIPDDQEPDVDEDGIPDDQEPDEDADGRPDDAERDSDEDGVPDDADPDDDDPAVPGEPEAPDEDADAVEDDEEAPKGRKDKRRA